MCMCEVFIFGHLTCEKLSSFDRHLLCSADVRCAFGITLNSYEVVSAPYGEV